MRPYHECLYRDIIIPSLSSSMLTGWWLYCRLVGVFLNVCPLSVRMWLCVCLLKVSVCLFPRYHYTHSYIQCGVSVFLAICVSTVRQRMFVLVVSECLSPDIIIQPFTPRLMCVYLFKCPCVYCTLVILSTFCKWEYLSRCYYFQYVNWPVALCTQFSA